MSPIVSNHWTPRMISMFSPTFWDEILLKSPILAPRWLFPHFLPPPGSYCLRWSHIVSDLFLSSHHFTSVSSVKFWVPSLSIRITAFSHLMSSITSLSYVSLYQPNTSMPILLTSVFMIPFLLAHQLLPLLPFPWWSNGFRLCYLTPIPRRKLSSHLKHNPLLISWISLDVNHKIYPKKHPLTLFCALHLTTCTSLLITALPQCLFLYPCPYLLPFTIQISSLTSICRAIIIIISRLLEFRRSISIFTSLANPDLNVYPPHLWHSCKLHSLSSSYLAS